MIIDIERLYSDFNIEIPPAGSKHVRPGWVQTTCPFCTGNFGYHLGYNTERGYFNCWRCGFHPTYKVLSVKLSMRPENIKELISGYVIRTKRGKSAPKRDEVVRKQGFLSFPMGTGKMGDIHRNYLLSRNFDPEELERVWGLLGTGPVGDYKLRVVAPITYQHNLVSYQARDITNLSGAKYKACAMENELIHHKHLLYGYDEAIMGSVPIIVEGITDVWRLGPGAVATFGIEYMPNQLLRIWELFKDAHRIFIIFDDDPQAQKQAKKMQASLELVGLPTEIETVDGDPGSLSESDVSYLLLRLNKKIFVFP